MITRRQQEALDEYNKLDRKSKAIRVRLEQGKFSGGDSDRVFRELKTELSKIESRRNTLIDQIPRQGR